MIYVRWSVIYLMIFSRSIFLENQISYTSKFSIVDHATQLTIAIENMTVLENSLCLIKAEVRQLIGSHIDCD